jgi:hypothetical protein
MIPAAVDDCGSGLRGIVTGSLNTFPRIRTLASGLRFGEKAQDHPRTANQPTREGMRNEEKEEEMGESHAYDLG